VKKLRLDNESEVFMNNIISSFFFFFLISYPEIKLVEHERNRPTKSTHKRLIFYIKLKARKTQQKQKFRISLRNIWV